MTRTPPRRFLSRALLPALCLSTGLAAPAPAAGQEDAPRAIPGDALDRARRLDATGHLAQALPLYRQAVAQARDSQLRRRIAVRLAIADAMRRPDTLIAFAAGKPPQEADAIAQILALLGRPRAALGLTGAGGTLADRLTRAQWALAANEPGAARQAAEQALAAAGGAEDRRYALAVLIEAYRASGDLAAALALLDRQRSDAAVEDARIDVLLELGRTAPALAAIARSGSPDVRRRLGGVLDLAGDRAASEAEYRRLIAADPHRVDPYARLAALYLTGGDEAQALATYRALFAANRGQVEVLTAAARAMIGMGLEDQAVAMLADGGGDPAASAATHLFLFETYADRGDVGRALAELQAVRQGDPRGLLLGDVAEGYVRLGRPAEALALLRRGEADGRPIGYDARVRIAQLAAVAGDDDDALRRWRALWADTALPARRSFIERQIIALARSMDRLDVLGQELSSRLDAGTLRPGEIDLLVALRLAQERPDAAADAVRRFAVRQGASEAATLSTLAQLYARIRDYSRLEDTLRRLIAIDPADRDSHVRQLILTLLQHDDATMPPAQRQAELDRLMAQLSDTDAAGLSAFKATVYAQADLNEQAIDTLRAGFAARPDDPDALSRLATELTRQHRLSDAVSLLQNAADGATVAPLFLAAIDGLIDLAAGADADDPDTAGVLDWAKRRVLERIATEGASPRLFGLIADIAAADADFDLQIRASEALLATAGERRGSVLRELATLSGGGSADGGRTFIGDPRRKLTYARRLLALGKSFPPDLYADLARTMLMQGDEAGAERAFAMMNGMGGLVDVDAAKGDAYAAAGRPAQALVNYARALLQDQTNLDLLVKTSILYERAGQDGMAQRWYWRGLRGLIARQPATPIATGDERGIDVRLYYPTLVEGLLLTWPDEAGARAAVLGDLDRRFGAEVAALDTATPGALADHPRLALLVDLGHRIVDAGKGNGTLAGWDAVLDRWFAGDAAYRRAAALRTHLTGSGDVAVAAPPPPWPLPALSIQAADTGDTELGFVLALSRGDDEAARAQLTAALADEEAARNAPAGTAPRAPVYLLLLADAMDRLPPDRFRDLALAPLQASKARDAILFDLFRAAPDRYNRMQTIAGAPLLIPDALVRMIVTQSNRPLGVSLRVSRRGTAGGGDNWPTRLSTGQQLALYDGLVIRLEQGKGDSMLSDIAVGELLHRPLAAGEQTRFGAILDRDIAVMRDPRTRSGAVMDGRLLQLDAVPANRELLLRAARAVAGRYPDSVLLPVVLERWYAGDTPQAFAALTALGDALRANGPSPSWFDPLVARRFPDAYGRQIEAFLSDPHPDPAAAAATYRRLTVAGAGTTEAQSVALTRRMAAIDPGNPAYRTRLLTLYAQQEDWAELEPVLQAYVADNPDDPFVATMLVLVYRLLGQSDRAAATAAASSVDADDPEWLVRLLNRSRIRRNQAGGGGVVGLFGAAYDAYLRQDPARPAVVAVEARQGRSAAPVVAGDDATLAPLVAAAQGDAAAAPRLLRALWRSSAAVPAEGGSSGRGRRALISLLIAAAGRQGVVSGLLARPAIIAELERYPGVLAPVDRAGQTALYAAAADVRVRRGAGAADLQAALTTLRTGRPDADAIGRLVALADRTGARLGQDDLTALDRLIRTTPAASAEGRLVLARLYAASGDLDMAGAFLEAAFLQILYGTGPLDAVADLSATMARMVATLDRWPDAAARAREHSRLAKILAIRALGPNGGDLPPLPPLPPTADSRGADALAGRGGRW